MTAAWEDLLLVPPITTTTRAASLSIERCDE